MKATLRDTAVSLPRSVGVILRARNGGESVSMKGNEEDLKDRITEEAKEILHQIVWKIQDLNRLREAVNAWSGMVDAIFREVAGSRGDQDE
ncbi:MAG: hypothetical protein ACE5NN_06925 [Candidatus Bathyarchaeia archaeon]